MSLFKWSIDSLIERDHTWFGVGWIFHEQRKITDLKLIPENSNGIDNKRLRHSIPIDFGKPRDDVKAAFGQQPNAARSGFLLLGRLPAAAGKHPAVQLACTLDDGTVHLIPVPRSAIVHLGEGTRAPFAHRLRQTRIRISKALRLVLSHRWNELFGKASRVIASQAGPASGTVEEILAQLKDAGRERIILWIDHDLGGGANLYRQRAIEQQLAAGHTVVTLSFNLQNLLPAISVVAPQLTLKRSIPSIQYARDLLRHLRVEKIVFNNAVSFPNPEHVADLILGVQRENQAALTVMIHDFLTVCPSQFLLADDDRFCGIPDPARCASCLPNNRHGFVSLAADRSIDAWRRCWGQVLQAANSIVAFSANSAALIRKAYPSLPADVIQVVPHVIDYLPAQAIHIAPDPRLKIGVVGSIGFHKGADIVLGLADVIKQTGANAEIIVIGKLEGEADPAILRTTGGYVRENLPMLIEEYGVNVMLFPSIVPETFSYVTQELIQLQLPVAVFNIGAPAERIAHYARGRILTSMAPQDVLQQLTQFHQELYFQPSEQQS